MGVYVDIKGFDGIPETYHIQFMHQRADETVVLTTQVNQKGKIYQKQVKLARACSCTIYKFVGISKVVVAHGVSKCSPKDHYIKSEGRIIALSKALYDSDLHPEIINTLLNGYVDRPGGNDFRKDLDNFIYKEQTDKLIKGETKNE